MAATPNKFDHFAYLDNIYDAQKNKETSGGVDDEKSIVKMTTEQEIGMQKFFKDFFTEKCTFIKSMDDPWAWLMHILLHRHPSTIINHDASTLGIRMTHVYNSSMVAADFIIELAEKLKNDEHWKNFKGIYHNEAGIQEFFKKIWKPCQEVIYDVIPDIMASLPPHRYMLNEEGGYDLIDGSISRDDTFMPELVE